MNKITQTLGIIKWYAFEKGFGVLSGINSEEVFLHHTNLLDYTAISNKKPKILVYEIFFSRNKISAKKCRPFNYSSEDFDLFYHLTIKFNSPLYVSDETNKKIKLVDLFEGECTYLIKIIETEIVNSDNTQFINKIQYFLSLFGDKLVSTDFINKESLKRFNTSDDVEFKKELIQNNFINTDNVNLDFIIKNLCVDEALINRIKNHPDFLNNILQILDVVKTTNLLKDVLYTSLSNSIQGLDLYIDILLKNIIDDEDISELNLLSKLISNNNITYDFQDKFEHLAYSKNNNKLIIEAYKKNIININKDTLIEKFIDSIDLDIFKKFEEDSISDKVIAILSRSKDQELIKYIISKFENFIIKDYQVFLKIGVDRLVFFDEENQIIYLKKLFHLKHLKKIDFKAKDLAIFIDISILKQAFDNKTDIDFSTFLIIDLIAKYDEKQGFMATHELIKSVLHIIQFDKTKKVQIDKYFDKCNGIARQKVSSSDKIITKEQFTTRQGTVRYYFKIEFPDDNIIKNDIQNIPGARYNSQENIWGVALKYEQYVLNLGKKYNFLIKREGTRKKYFEDNSHLLEIIKSEKEKPIGITYCCGQEAQKSSFSGKKFWWCNQNPCFANNINKHENWQEYTLFNFMKILSLDLTEHSKDGSVYKIGLYTRFVAFLNRFNKLLEKLYCNECDHVLYPLETSNFHKFSVTKFVCKNENCIQLNKVIYLNHCLNGQCNAIIDSRCSEKCPNGLYICDECGSCCSHASFKRRLESLRINGGIQYERLYQLVQIKAGHLEKAEYYCYKCGQFMTEYSRTLYKCSTCNIEYDLSKYSQITKQQIHVDLRTENYPNKSALIEERLKNILLKEKEELEYIGKTKKQIFGILFNKEIEIDGESFYLKDINNKKLTNNIFG